MARIQWTTDTPPNSANSDYTLIEVSVDGGAVWAELVTSGTGVEDVRVPGSSPDTRYLLRGRGGSNLPGIGQGEYFTSTIEYTAYQSGTKLVIAWTLVVRNFSSGDAISIIFRFSASLEWSLSNAVYILTQFRRYNYIAHGICWKWVSYEIES